jgi:transcriptional repressor NrdR
MIFILKEMESFKYQPNIQHNVGWPFWDTIYCILSISVVMKMECPYCHNIETKVTDSRDTGTYTIRRRRECLKCNKRFTTYEYIELTPIYIKKKDGRLEKYDRNKIKNGIMKALEKRPVGHDKIEEIIDSIEEKIRRNGKEELESSIIGEYVMEKLKETDHVAYIRFASVYRSFTDASSFQEEVNNLIDQSTGERRD